jgi:hypothetical protein
MTDLSRRDLLAAAGAGAAGLYVVGRSNHTSSSTGTLSSGGAGLRWHRLRPAPGGASLGVTGTDKVGSAAAGVRGPDGEPWLVTARHVVDPGYPESDESDVVGTDVYQPDSTTEDSPIGVVVDVGPSQGADATDWAVLELSSPDVWTRYVVGLGAVGGRYDPAEGDRVIVNGLGTGIHGGEVTAIGVSATWAGTLMYDLIEYVVDDAADTAGNSGGWLGRLDPAGTFRPVGIHVFRNDDRRYAVPVSQCVDDPGGSLSTDGDATRPTAPELSGALLEGAIGVRHDDGGVVDCQVANVGDQSATDRLVRVYNTDGDEVDRTTVSLDPLDETTLELDAPASGPVTLDVGDEEVTQTP